jgi:hypothetical protein
VSAETPASTPRTPAGLFYAMEHEIHLFKRGEISLPEFRQLARIRQAQSELLEHGPRGRNQFAVLEHGACAILSGGRADGGRSPGLHTEGCYFCND